MSCMSFDWSSDVNFHTCTSLAHKSITAQVKVCRMANEHDRPGSTSYVGDPQLWEIRRHKPYHGHKSSQKPDEDCDEVGATWTQHAARR
eukprot:7887166-Pyramimonas_sp.AAC.3